MRLAEIGDMQAVPTLAWKLRQDPVKLYADPNDQDYIQGDGERIAAGGILADLAVSHASAQDRGTMKDVAESAVLSWLVEKPLPWASGLRFVATVKSQEGMKKLLAWADPSVPLPSDKADLNGGIPREWESAGSALRYLGMSKDPGAYAILTKQLTRRPAKVSLAWADVKNSGAQILNLTLMALAAGACDGLAELGDPKAFKPMVDFILSEKENEETRSRACDSLAWVASPEQMKDVVKMVHDYNKSDEKSVWLRGCFLRSLVRHPVGEATEGLFDLLDPKVVADADVRHTAARAIGMGRLTDNMLKKLMDKVKEPPLRTDAMLAILVGSDSPDAAVAAFVSAYEEDPTLMEELKDVYNGTFVLLTDKNYENEDVRRWVENAEALSHVKVGEKYQDWAKRILQQDLRYSFERNTGPHSITRAQLRWRLYADARGGNDVKRTNAISILKFLNERGVLMALRDEKAPVGDMARQAYFEVTHPKAEKDRLPDRPEPPAKKKGN
jgi:HEAT repeat protein